MELFLQDLSRHSVILRTCMIERRKRLTGIIEAPSRLFADSVASVIRREIVLFLIILGIGEHGVVVVVRLVLRFPCHLVFLFETSPRVREPSGDLSQRHLRDDSQHNLLAFRRIRVLLVLVQPSLQGRRRFSRGILPPCGQIVAGAVSERKKNNGGQLTMRSSLKSFEKISLRAGEQRLVNRKCDSRKAEM